METTIKEFKGTKWPWKMVEHNWSDSSIYGDDGHEMVCTNSIYDDATEETQEELEAVMSANFKLIAAAPELLAACQEFVRKVECGEAKSKKSYQQMKSAISSAIGE